MTFRLASSHGTVLYITSPPVISRKADCFVNMNYVMRCAVEVIGAVGCLVNQDQPSYLVAGGALVNEVAAILSPLAARCWRMRGHLLAILLLVAMVPALSLIFTAAVERTGGARDEANRDRQAIAQRIELTRAAERDAKVIAGADEAAAMAECSRAQKGADPRGPACKSLEARADNSRQRLKEARDAVAQAGVVPTDPQARRIAAILPVSEEAAALYQPLILPLSISALGLLLIAVGAHSPKPRKVSQKRTGKRKWRKALGASPARKHKASAVVLPFARKA